MVDVQSEARFPALVPDLPGQHGQADPPTNGDFGAAFKSRPLPADLFRAGDAAAMLAALFAVFLLANLEQMTEGWEQFLALRISLKNALFLGLFLILWQLTFSLLSLYDRSRFTSLADEMLAVLVATSVASVGALLLPLLSRTGSFQLHDVFFFWIVASVSTGVLRSCFRTVERVKVRRARSRNVLIVGSGPRAEKLHRYISDDSASNRAVMGFVDTNAEVRSTDIRHRLLGDLDRLEAILVGTVIDEVLIALPIRSRYAEIQEVIRTCERVGVESKYLADVFQSSLSQPRLEPAAGLPLVAHKVAEDDFRLVIKRGIDVVGAAVGLVILSPAMFVIAAVIKFTSPGPALFSQYRYGYNRRLFKMYKFRSMVMEADRMQDELEDLNEAEGPVFKIRRDPRSTAFGRFLRRTSLDELPQLINVLRGEMSLVGPRPLPTRDVRHFSESWLMRRFSVLPGLTCLWQISGRSNLDFDDWIALDLRYIDNWSLSLDLRVLARTIPVVIRGTGAN